MTDTNRHYEINSVNFSDDEVTFVYMHVPDDVRSGGNLVATHTLRVSAAKWAEEIAELKGVVVELLVDTLEDFGSSEAVDLADLNDPDDDERGMGDP